ncbi:uncharacterized protein LOC112041495 [Lingula anatina]|uniref:Uncharacterized protein LOC112041495 n=1 Tax=Lingula anatina TaxID=7574 RepID=A0A2R2MKJ3_LINAN|nr:uncharacterized protein LOC112041495 [Lingula anatina]|eukprot:XP_023930587.1 uncharacterized protein LOC112041495 [Lingula anatina]
MYFDKCLPFGLSCSCQLFEIFSSSVEWIAKEKLAIPHIIHLLDDFFIAANTKDSCEEHLSKFLDTCNDLGIPMSKEKTTKPATTISFAGIELDSVAYEARLPSDKITNCLSLIEHNRTKKKITLQELQSIIGTLNFCCYIIPSGRAFLRRLIDLTKGITKPHHKIRLNKEARSDLLMWDGFLRNFNGKALIHSEGWDSNTSFQLYTDSSTTFGYGAISDNEWFYGPWTPQQKQLNITTLEFYPILAAFLVWSKKFTNKKVTIHSDNEALVYILNKCSTTDPLLLTLLRKLILTSMRHNIAFRSVHIPGVKNTSADALSRLNLQKFHQASPQALPYPTQIPAQWLPNAFI